MSSNWRRPVLSQQLLDYLPVNVGETELPALELEGKPGVVESQQMQQSRLYVVNVDAVDGRETQLVRTADDLSGANAASSH